MKKESLATLATTAALVAGLFFSLGGPTTFAAETAAGAHGKTSIVVGADTTFPPFETEKNGKVTGFDIDMIKAIAKAENLKVTLKTMPFDGIIPSLQAGSVDVAVAGITIKQSRMQSVNFSNAYYKSGLSVLVKSNSKIKSFADLKGHVIATKKATSSVDYMMGHGIDSKYIKQFQNIDVAYQALETGGADAVVFDNPVNVNFKVQHKNVKIVGGLLTGEYYGIALTKKAPDLVNKINDGLEKIKKDGTYRKLFVQYFGGDTNGMVNEIKTPADVAVAG